ACQRSSAGSQRHEERWQASRRWEPAEAEARPNQALGAPVILLHDVVTGNIRYHRTAHTITSAVNCRPLKQLPQPIAMSRPMQPASHYTAASRVSKFATEPLQDVDLTGSKGIRVQVDLGRGRKRSDHLTEGILARAKHALSLTQPTKSILLLEKMIHDVKTKCAIHLELLF